MKNSGDPHQFNNLQQAAILTLVQYDNSFQIWSTAAVYGELCMPMPGFLLEAGSQVPAPVYFELSTRLLKV